MYYLTNNFCKYTAKHLRENMLFEEINEAEGKKTKAVNKNVASGLSQSTCYTLCWFCLKVITFIIKNKKHFHSVSWVFSSCTDSFNIVIKIHILRIYNLFLTLPINFLSALKLKKKPTMKKTKLALLSRQTFPNREVLTAKTAVPKRDPCRLHNLLERLSCKISPLTD